MKKKILFVAYGGGHIKAILPVLRHMDSFYPNLEIILLALTMGHRIAANERLCYGYKDFIHLLNKNDVNKWGKLLLNKNQSPDVSTEESIAYLGVNYIDLISQYGEQGAQEIYKSKGRYGFFPKNFFKILIKEIKPDLVFTTNSPRSEQAALECAKEAGIPTAALIDLFGLTTDEFTSRKIKPDITCVISDEVKRRLENNGLFPKNSVITTGNPAFDGLLLEKNQINANKFLHEKKWSELKVILYAGDLEPMPHPESPIPPGKQLPLEIEATLRKMIDKNPNIALIIRYHPRDWHTYPPHPHHPRIHFSQTPFEEIHPLILASNIVVVQVSTVGLEAAIAGKPVISIENSPAAHIWFSYAKLGLSTPCESPSKLPYVIQEILDTDPNCLLTSFATDGNSAQRVADVIAELIDCKCNNKPI